MTVIRPEPTLWGQKPKRRAGTPPPHDLATERALIADVLFDEERAAKGEDRALPQCAGLLPKHFFYDRHEVLWTAILYLQELGDPYDVMGVMGELRRQGVTKEAGGAAYLGDIVSSSPWRGQPEKLARKLIELAAHRDYIERLHYLANEGYHAPSGAAFTAEATEELAQLAQAAQPAGEGDMEQTARVGQDEYDEAVRRKEQGGDILTHLAELDAVTHGLHRGELTILHAPSGSAKSALSQQLALTTASAGHGVYIAALEMGRRELLWRWISQVSHAVQANYRHAAQGGELDEAPPSALPFYRFREASLSPSQRTQMTKVSDHLRRLPIIVDDEQSLPNVTWATLKARILHAKARCKANGTPLGLVIVDYLQLMDPETGRKSLSQAYMELGRKMKTSMAQLDAAMVVIAAENDAQTIYDCPRIRYHAHNMWRLSLRKDEPSPFNPEAVPAAIEVTKQRHGKFPVTAATWFHGPYLRFSDKEQVQ